jgi:chromosome segregation ATPase
MSTHVNVLVQDALILQRLLWKLYHIEEKIGDNVKAIRSQNKELGGLREEQKEHQGRLSAAREEQATARSEVSKRERRIKKQEKALEAKVIHFVSARPHYPDLFLPLTATQHGCAGSSDGTL